MFECWGKIRGKGWRGEKERISFRNITIFLDLKSIEGKLSKDELKNGNARFFSFYIAIKRGKIRIKRVFKILLSYKIFYSYFILDFSVTGEIRHTSKQNIALLVR